MIKRLLCTVLICACTALLASCGCSNTVETRPPESIEITPEIQIGQYASYVTQYKWINEKTGDVIDFNDNGTFTGKIASKSYSGKFTLRVDKEKLGKIISGVTLDGTDKEVEYTIQFKDSAHIKVTTDKKVSEDYTADWAVEKSE